MYTDLRQFELAKTYMQEMSGGEQQAQKLISLQAEWANTTNNAEAAWWERERQRKKQSERQTNRQRQTDRQRGTREREGTQERERDKDTQRERERERERETKTQRERKTKREAPVFSLRVTYSFHSCAQWHVPCCQGVWQGCGDHGRQLLDSEVRLMIDSRGSLQWVANWHWFVWYCRIIELSNDLDKSMKEALRQSAYQLKKLGEVKILKEIQTKSSDTHTMVFFHSTTMPVTFMRKWRTMRHWQLFTWKPSSGSRWVLWTWYRVAGKLGEVFNLVNWWIYGKLSNLKPSNI